MAFVISFVDGRDTLSVANPTAKEALATAATLIAQGRQCVIVTNSETGEVYGTDQVQRAMEQAPDRP